MENYSLKFKILHCVLPFCQPVLLRKALLAGIFIFTFCIFSEANAARLYFEPSEGVFPPESSFSVDIKLDTEGEEINTVEVRLESSDDILMVEDFSDSDSIVNFWIEKPALRNQIISFAGIVPGGFLGKSGTLLRIFLKASREGFGKLNFRDDSQVFLNDGEGTLADLAVSKAEFLISKQIPNTQPQIPKVDDREPPEHFKPEVVQDPSIFGGQYFLVFATQDKGSGIKSYEIKELKMTNYELLNEEALNPAGYNPAESPYLLKDQKLTSVIFAKATDKQGNQIVESLLPRYKYVPWYTNYQIWIIIILVIIICCIIWIMKRKKLFSI